MKKHTKILKKKLKSFDPKLKEERGDPAHARFNGSACYACCLLPETSCEEFNRLLDRKLLFDKKIGYFSDFVE